MAQINPLRPITQRLNLTPVEDLPRYAGFLAASILNCSDHLRGYETTKNDGSVQVHKLITRVSSLLQDRAQEARFTGVVLVKALIESLDPPALALSGSTWVRSLISCLNRPDPPQVRKLSVIAIARLFLITKDDQAIVREITTPSLPPFMTACLNAIKPTISSTEGVERQVLSPLLQPVLQCWAHLLKVFPSTFRPFVSSIRNIVLSLISSQTTPEDVKQVASQAFAALHFCAPKDTASSEWALTVKKTIEAIHQNADIVFRSVIEEWLPVGTRQSVTLVGKRVKNEVHLADADAVGMDRWTGLYAGCSRIVDLLHLLIALLVSQHASAVAIPTAEVFDLIARFAAVMWPTEQYSLRENKEITRDEREELFINLPRIHGAVLELNESVTKAYGRTGMSGAQQTLSQIWDIVDSESISDHVRTSVYNAISILLQQRTVSLTKNDTEHISELIHLCCKDLTSSNAAETKPTGKGKTSTSLLHVSDKGRQSRENTAAANSFNKVSNAAWKLLPILLTHVPAHLLTSSMRTEIDRTTILIGHEEAMLASVLNPPLPRKGSQLTPSILPFLARSAGDNLSIEALMRPRVPILDGATRSTDAEEGEDQTQHIPQTDANLEDPNLRVISNNINQQMDVDEIAAEEVEINDSYPSKKRDFTAAEDTTARFLEESSKRAKTDLHPTNAERSPERSESDTQENLVPIEAASAAPDDRSQVALSSVPSAKDTPFGSSITSKTIMPVLHNQDDDSDDSEIPLIDTALSSDEDEDEDEGDSGD